MYEDRNLVKNPSPIQVRLDEYEQQRVRIACAGGQLAVWVRDAVMEKLDRDNVRYDDAGLNKNLDSRRFEIAIQDRIKRMEHELDLAQQKVI